MFLVYPKFKFNREQSIQRPEAELGTEIQRQVVLRDELRREKLGEMREMGLTKIILSLSQQNTREKEFLKGFFVCLFFMREVERYRLIWIGMLERLFNDLSHVLTLINTSHNGYRWKTILFYTQHLLNFY